MIILFLPPKTGDDDLFYLPGTVWESHRGEKEASPPLFSPSASTPGLTEIVDFTPSSSTSLQTQQPNTLAKLGLQLYNLYPPASSLKEKKKKRK